MEFKYLAHLTGKQEYFNKVENVVDIMEQRQRPNGMWGVQWNPDTGVNHDGESPWIDALD
jgi:mannosyl-oligosaccharide alpha-1,2-mannosidase